MRMNRFQRASLPYPPSGKRKVGYAQLSRGAKAEMKENGQDFAVTGYTLTLRLASPPSNFTTPVTRAKSV